jgi:hypothetical protein
LPPPRMTTTNFSGVIEFTPQLAVLDADQAAPAAQPEDLTRRKWTALPGRDG